jgi:hypothetical protein
LLSPHQLQGPSLAGRMAQPQPEKEPYIGLSGPSRPHSSILFLSHSTLIIIIIRSGRKK